MKNGPSFKEALRLHSFYCAGCSEYGNHRTVARGGARVDVAKVPSGTDAGFDSPPPPSHKHDVDCLRGKNYHFDDPHVHNKDCYDC
jgi:hypothetical protein